MFAHSDCNTAIRGQQDKLFFILQDSTNTKILHQDALKLEERNAINERKAA